MAAATALTRPSNVCLWQVWEVPSGGRLIILRQLLLWWFNSPWAPGHKCGVSVMLVVCGSTSLFSSRAGTHQIRDQSCALEDRNDSKQLLRGVHT